MAPAFIFVDPYGFKVPGGLLSALMAAGRIELFVNVIWRELDMAIRQRPGPTHGLATTLDEIFVGDSWRGIDGDTPDRRQDQATQLLADAIGAKWCTHVRMSTGGTTTRYLLLHLTNHDQGRDLMKECMWNVAPDAVSTSGFKVRWCEDPQQPRLITREPDLAPLGEWLLARLRQRPYRRAELRREIRRELWLDSHLRMAIEQLQRDHQVDIDRESGAISITANPRLFH